MKRLSRAMRMAAVILVLASSAAADDSAQSFVQTEYQRLTQLLRQPYSAARDGEISHVLDGMVDYDELVRRAFREHWNELTDAQRTEVHGLLKTLVERNYRKNLAKTLNYDLTIRTTTDQGGDTRVRTEAKSRTAMRDPPVQVDYVLRGAPGSYRVVDIVTEGSSLTKNYYDQFHKMLTTPGQGYSYLVGKLRDKVNKT